MRSNVGGQNPRLIKTFRELNEERRKLRGLMERDKATDAQAERYWTLNDEAVRRGRIYDRIMQGYIKTRDISIVRNNPYFNGRI